MRSSSKSKSNYYNNNNYNSCSNSPLAVFFTELRTEMSNNDSFNSSIRSTISVAAQSSSQKKKKRSRQGQLQQSQQQQQRQSQQQQQRSGSSSSCCTDSESSATVVSSNTTSSSISSSSSSASASSAASGESCTSSSFNYLKASASSYPQHHQQQEQEQREQNTATADHDHDNVEDNTAVDISESSSIEDEPLFAWEWSHLEIINDNAKMPTKRLLSQQASGRRWNPMDSSTHVLLSSKNSSVLNSSCGSSSSGSSFNSNLRKNGVSSGGSNAMMVDLGLRPYLRRSSVSEGDLQRMMSPSPTSSQEAKKKSLANTNMTQLHNILDQATATLSPKLQFSRLPLAGGDSPRSCGSTSNTTPKLSPGATPFKAHMKLGVSSTTRGDGVLQLPSRSSSDEGCDLGKLNVDMSSQQQQVSPSFPKPNNTSDLVMRDRNNKTNKKKSLPSSLSSLPLDGSSSSSSTSATKSPPSRSYSSPSGTIHKKTSQQLDYRQHLLVKPTRSLDDSCELLSFNDSNESLTISPRSARWSANSKKNGASGRGGVRRSSSIDNDDLAFMMSPRSARWSSRSSITTMSPSTLLAEAGSPSSSSSLVATTPSPSLSRNDDANKVVTNKITTLLAVPWGDDSTNSLSSVGTTTSASPGNNVRSGSNNSGMIATSLGVDSVMTQPVRSPATPVTPVAKQKLRLNVVNNNGGDSDDSHDNDEDGMVHTTAEDGATPALAKIVAPF